MKKLLLLTVALFTFFAIKVNAQVSTLTFSSSVGPYMEITGGTLIAEATVASNSNFGIATLDDARIDGVVIPFPFMFNGNPYTELSINCNGYVTFGGTLSGTATYTPISSTTAYDGAIAPVGRDIRGTPYLGATRTTGSSILTDVTSFGGVVVGKTIAGTGIPATATIVSFDVVAGTITMSENATSDGTNTLVTVGSGDIRSEVRGTAPNRIFVIQFRYFAAWSSSLGNVNGDNYHFQILLYETKNRVQIVYGNVTSLSTFNKVPQVGLRGASNADFNNRTTTTNWSATTAGVANSNTCALTNTVFPENGLTYSWPALPQVLLFEDFETGVGQTPPPLWDNVNNPGGNAAQIWTFRTDSASVVISGGGFADKYAILNSDAYGSGNTQNVSLISPVINCSGVNNVRISFSEQYRTISGQTGTFAVSTDGGSSWTDLFERNNTVGNVGYPNPGVVTQLFVPQAANQPNVKFRWTYVGTFGWWWAIDNVTVQNMDNPSISVTPPSIDFGNMPVGEATPNQTITIKNDGVGTLTITSVSKTGTNPGDFNLIDGNVYPVQLAFNESITVDVNFQPTASGARDADISIVHNAAGSPTLVNLSGTGVTLGNIISTGAGGDWSNPATWVGGVVPTATDNATIASGAIVTVDGTTAECYNLNVGQGALDGGPATLTFPGGTTAATITIMGDLFVKTDGAVNAGGGTGTKNLIIGGTNTSNSSGSLVVNGSFNVDQGASFVATTFRGAFDGSISGTGLTCNFYSITVNKGTNKDAIIDVQRTIGINSPAVSANRLVITTGTFKLSTANTLAPYGGTQTICASTGRLWLDNAAANIGMGTFAGSPTVAGELRIDEGTFTYGVGNNALTFTSGSGILEMHGGTLTMYGTVTFGSNANTFMNMSGGHIIADWQHTANSTATTQFTIGSLTTVDWSGGTITLVDPRATVGGTNWSAATGGVKNITGGTLRIGDGVSTAASGVLGSTAGFGMTSSMPIWNLEVNTRNDLEITRFLRITGTTVTRNSVLNEINSYIFCGTGATSTIFSLQGNFVNNGTFAGTFPTGATYQGDLRFAGTDAQSISGSGTWVNLANMSVANTGGTLDAISLPKEYYDKINSTIENQETKSISETEVESEQTRFESNERVRSSVENSATRPTLEVEEEFAIPHENQIGDNRGSSNIGTINTDNMIVVNRTNMFFGQINPNGKLTVGRVTAPAVANPIVQIGQAGNPLPAGSFTQVPLFDNTQFATYYIWSGSSLGATTTGDFNEIPPGDQTITQFFGGNAAGLTTDRNFLVNSFMTFSAGIITTSATTMITLGPGAAITGASATNYNNGPFAWINNTTSLTTRLFPVGKNGNYRPMNLTTTQDDVTPTTYIGEQFDSPAPSYNLPLSLDRVSFVRYFNITKGAGANITAGAIELSYGADDDAPDAPNLRIAKQNGANWDDIGGTGTAPGTGTITSTINFTSLSDFALANATGGGNPLPVELTSFTASIDRRDVHLNWTTASEINNSGFDIERKAEESVSGGEIWTKAGFVEGNGTTNEAMNYSFTDRNLNTGSYSYRLKQIDYNGNFEFFNLSNEVNIGVPDKYDLSQNYPNPFNPTTKINFDLPFDSKVTMTIFDITGRQIATLVNDVQTAGYYTVTFDARNISSGTYFYRIIAEGGNQQYVMTKKMMVVK